MYHEKNNGPIVRGGGGGVRAGHLTKRGPRYLIYHHTSSVNLPTLIQDFSPVVYSYDQLSFTAMLFPDACYLSDKSLCSSKCVIIFEQTICSNNLHGTQVRET